MSLLYYSVTPLLCYWVCLIMATQVNCISLELIVAFLVFVNAIYLLALFMFRILVNILSVQSYSTACIWVHPQCTWIFCSQTRCSVAQHFYVEFGSASLCVSIICFFLTSELNIKFSLHFALLRLFCLSLCPG